MCFLNSAFRFPRTVFGLLLWGLTLGGTACGQAAPEEPMKQLKTYSQHLKSQFPDIPFVSTEALARSLSGDHAPTLIDVRSAKEFAVSRLPGSHRAESVAEVQSLNLAPSTPIVVYCSVGYRSGMLARKLRAAGFTNVRNLEGSLFAWANENRPMVNDFGPADGAHPFNIWWGRYLDKSKWQGNYDGLNQVR